MAEVHLSALRRVRPRGPYRLGGNCNGGLVAFEMARRLARAGERVERLVVVRASARGVRNRRHAAAARALAALLRRPGAAERWRERFVQLDDAWRGASSGERLRLVRDKVRRLPGALAAQPLGAGAPPGPSPAGRLDRERLRDAYVRAAALYVPARYAGRVTVFWPERDEESPSDAVRWWRQVAADVELQVLPGDHLSYATRHVEAFARALDACLDGAAPGPRAGPGRDAC
jgi:thioesterase domain-containing protein